MSKSSLVQIRASMLDEYLDCPRRAVAKNYPSLVPLSEVPDFVIDERIKNIPQSAGALVGKAVHLSAENILTQKRSGQLVDWHYKWDETLELLNTEAKAGFVADKTTGSPEIAAKQVEKILREFNACYVPYVTPLIIEEGFKTKSTDQGWILTGHPDVVLEGGVVDDIKTGAVKPKPWAQLGAYKILLEAYGLEITFLRAVWFKRVGIKAEQPDMGLDPYPVSACYEAAIYTLERVAKDVRLFIAERDPNVFPANPRSMSCSQKYCPAWGTTWCNLWKTDKQEETIDYD